MKLALILTTASVLFLSAVRAEDTTFPPINPALLYWQAAALRPALSDAQATELRDIASGKQPADPEKHKASGGDSVAEILRRAAASPAPCDWGLLTEAGPTTPLPHLSKVRELADLAIVEAEVALAQGNVAKGIDWLMTAHRIARHSGAGGILISFLVQSAIETKVLNAAGRHSLGWDEATRRDYAQRMKALPPLVSLQESYHGEINIPSWLEQANQLTEPQRTEKLQELFNMVDGKEQENLSKLMDTEILRKELAALREFHGRNEAAIGKPWREGKAEFDAIEKATQQSGFTLIKMSLPAIPGVYEKAFHVATRRTMLEAALEHGAQLDESLAATYRDAFEGQPLRLQKSPDGVLSLVAAQPDTRGNEIQLHLGR
jgi:hypothetical protein